MAQSLIDQVRAAFMAGDVLGAQAKLQDRLAAEPRDREARIELARLLRYRGRFVEALRELDDAAEPDGSLAAPLLRASLLSRLGRHQEAVLAQRLAVDQEEHPRALLGLAHLLKTVGDIGEAANVSRRALALDPRLGEGWWTLSSLKTVGFSDEDRAAMCSLVDDPATDSESRMYVHFALARAFDAAGEPASSWHHLSEANRIRAAEVGHKPGDLSALVDATIEWMTPDLFDSRENWGDPSAGPIFIVGMPRSGTTLLEQMLASHSQIEGVAELPDIPALARQIGGTEGYIDARYLQRLAELSADQVRALGTAYLDRSRPQRVLGRPFFVDKMPNNWLFAGLIRLILPNARIIDMRRHPLDCGLSNFRELFARGQTYSYDLGHIGAYYADYVRLMAHFDRVQPGEVHRLIYERLVDDPESELRALFDYLGIPFEDSVLRFHETERGVRTASAAQVRQPLNRKGIGQWQRYDRWLGPLRDSLGPVLANWDSP